MWAMLTALSEVNHGSIAVLYISFYLQVLPLDQGFPTRGARQHLRGCEMIIQIFVLHFCPVMLSSSCANSSAQSVFNYSMPKCLMRGLQFSPKQC